MIQLQILIMNAAGDVLEEVSAKNECRMVYAREYLEGDTIVIRSSQKNIHLNLSLDDVLGNSFVYFSEEEMVYHIPFGEKRISYSPKAFAGELHLIEVRAAEEREIKNWRNLAYNIYDQHAASGVYPHAHANVETRGESVFAARNAIDGNRFNHSHGEWPFESWGINQQDDAWMEVEFGREVAVSMLKLYTRADFPHDNWWASVTVCFSDGSVLVWRLIKSSEAQILSFEEKKVHSIRICKLIKAEDPSPFPALSQIEVYGTEA